MSATQMLRKGILVEADKRLLKVHDYRPQNNQIVLEGELGELELLKLSDVYNKIASGEIRPIYTEEREKACLPERNLSGAERDALKKRKEIIKDIEKLRKKGAAWKEIAELLGDNAPAIRTMQRWYAKSLTCVNHKDLAPFYSGRGNRFRKMSDLAVGLLHEVLFENLKANVRLNATAITILVNNRIRKACENLDVIFEGVSKRSVVRAIKSIAQIDEIRNSVDPRTLRNDLKSALKSFFVEEPYARVEFDSTLLNLLIVDNDGNVIGKPTIYLLIDCATGAILAFSLSIQAESQDTFLRLLEMAFMPRSEFLRRYNVKKPLPGPALWHVQACDNSAAHHGAAMLRALDYLGVTVEFSKAGTPTAHPFVERTHGSLKTGLIQFLCGVNFSTDVREKDPYGKAVKNAKYTLREAEQLVARWICDKYMNTPLKRLTERFNELCSPRQAMDRLIKIYPLIPPPTPKEFREACMNYGVKEVSLGRDGINFQTFKYQSDELYDLFLGLPPKSKVEVRWHPLDVSYVYVVAKGKQMLTVPNKQRNLPPMSFAEAKDIRKKLYKSDAALSEEEYIQNYAEILEDVLVKNSSPKVSQKRAAARAKDKQATTREIKKSRATQTPSSLTDGLAIDLEALQPLPTRQR